MIIIIVFVGGIITGAISLMLDACIRGWLRKEFWELPVWYLPCLVFVSVFAFLFIAYRVTHKQGDRPC